MKDKDVSYTELFQDEAEKSVLYSLKEKETVEFQGLMMQYNNKEYVKMDVI